MFLKDVSTTTPVNRSKLNGSRDKAELLHACCQRLTLTKASLSLARRLVTKDATPFIYFYVCGYNANITIAFYLN